MTDQHPYTVLFVYDVQDHALKFPLQADVDCSVPGIYTITNIRLSTQAEGSLLPRIQLTKRDGAWIFVDTQSPSLLSAAIGAAIDERQRATYKNPSGSGAVL